MAQWKIEKGKWKKGRGCFPFSLFLFSFSIIFVAGCATQKRAEGPRPYYGPTETMAQVVERINRNNRPIVSLWARQSFEARLFDEKGESHFVNGDGSLVFRKPRELKLTGTKPFVKIFEIGSTAERYWLEIPEQLDTMWWGWYRNVGKPCVRTVPVRPDLMIDVLGVGEIDPDFNHQPAPVMRFNPDADAYMFLWTVHEPDRWIAQKEVWYDRKTLHPQLVLLFDPNGRVVLRAYLSKFEPVEVAEAPRAQWPTVATNYRLFFPDSGSTMTFQLKDVRLSYKGAPRPGSIRFPVEPGVSKVIQVDEDCP